MKKRQLSDKFMNDLLTGCLNPLLKEVQEDDTLCLELRGNFSDPCQKDEAINIYYRGGSLFKIVRKEFGYDIFFDVQYLENVKKSSLLNPNPDIEEAVEKIALYKHAIDKSQKISLEKEFQQLIERVNNRIESNGKVSNGTDYFIVDLEFQTSAGDITEKGFRADMIAIKWLSNKWDRQNINKPTLALIEVKYGTESIETKLNSPGLGKHLCDINQLFQRPDLVKELCNDMSEVFRQKCELGLVKGLEKHQYNVSINPNAPEAIFVIADYKPSRNNLKKELQCYATSVNGATFPVKVTSASMMGYGLYEKTMVDLNQIMVNLGILMDKIEK